MFQWGIYDKSKYDDGFPTVGSKKLSELRDFYGSTDAFVVDEGNALSAAMLAQMHDTMSAIFNPGGKKDRQGDDLPFGGKKNDFFWEIQDN